jgi:hypothetical protein
MPRFQNGVKALMGSYEEGVMLGQAKLVMADDTVSITLHCITLHCSALHSPDM